MNGQSTAKRWPRSSPVTCGANPQERKTPFYQFSHTYQMKCRTEYLRRENLKAARPEVANFKRCRKLVDQWADAALKLFRLKTRLGLHSDES